MQPPLENDKPAEPNAVPILNPLLKEYIESHLPAFTDLAQSIVAEIANPPEQFVKDLQEATENNNLNIQMFLEYLKNHTIEEIFQMLDTLNTISALSPYIQKIKENRGWVEAVLRRIK